MSIRKIILSVLALYCILALSCKSPAISTLWKPQPLHSPVRKASTILVICITKDTGIQVRSNVESGMTEKLQSLGYQAISALEGFGRQGLVLAGREDVLRTLCDHGIDALITVAFIDKGKDVQAAPNKNKTYSAGYYYNRIANYRDITADVAGLEQEATATAYWEVVVFDLFTLAPVDVMRTKTYYITSALDMYQELPGLIITKLLKEKILVHANLR